MFRVSLKFFWMAPRALCLPLWRFLLFLFFFFCCCLAYFLKPPLSPVFVIVYPLPCLIPAAWPHLLLFSLLCSWLRLFFTCDPSGRLPVASPPLQEKEVVTPFRHPELQGVFQQNFLRVQPHIFQQGRTGGTPPPSRSSQGWMVVVVISFAGPPALERPDRSYSGGFSGLSMVVLRSRQLQASHFLASSDPSRPICSSCTHCLRSSI